VLGMLLKKVVDQQISVKSAREVFNRLLAESDAGNIPQAERVEAIIADEGLAIVSDTGELERAIEAVLAKNAKIVEDVRGGKQAAVGPLIGQVMKEVKGADPKQVREMVLAKIMP
jgi:aspartyl-tRNA(Asn)/glutamyl-tRNA(Gln) amidotransferase subunit B